MSNPAVKQHFMELPQDKVQVMYVWIDGLGDLRGKTMTLDKVPTNVNELKIWNHDGSSCNQAEGCDSDVYTKPVAIFKDPFRKGDNRIVLCETLEKDRITPHSSNSRFECNEVMKKSASQKPWFGIEQEYVLINSATNMPLGFPEGGYPAPQGPYYCGTGEGCVVGRDIVECHYRACIYAGVKIAGSNAEVMLGQWEYQVGPCEGIEMGDHLWMSRYLLQRVAEMFNVKVSFHPKPVVVGEWNGSGGHTNISTEQMRQPNGIKHINEAIAKMSKNHDAHIKVYGAHNEMRLTGQYETANIKHFKSGVADRGSSIRIPRQCSDDGCGYFEDRRPASNLDPYVVTSRVIKTICLNMP